jgi:hypothetical protein
VATFKIFDRADEFRIEIIGRFAGEAVSEIRNSWERALCDTAPRRLSVDISRLSGYDAAGRKLLSEMNRHGTEFAARTPSSLVFLDEISSLLRNPPTVIPRPLANARKASLEAGDRAIAVGQ